MGEIRFAKHEGQHPHLCRLVSRDLRAAPSLWRLAGGAALTFGSWCFVDEKAGMESVLTRLTLNCGNPSAQSKSGLAPPDLTGSLCDSCARAVAGSLQHPTPLRTQIKMTEMFDFGWSERPYWDRKNWSSLEGYKEALKTSTTLYVGNLSFYTQESQIYALFDQVSEPRTKSSVTRAPVL